MARAKAAVDRTSMVMVPWGTMARASSGQEKMRKPSNSTACPTMSTPIAKNAALTERRCTEIGGMADMVGMAEMAEMAGEAQCVVTMQARFRVARTLILSWRAAHLKKVVAGSVASRLSFTYLSGVHREFKWLWRQIQRLWRIRRTDDALQFQKWKRMEVKVFQFRQCFGRMLWSTRVAVPHTM